MTNPVQRHSLICGSPFTPYRVPLLCEQCDSRPSLDPRTAREQWHTRNLRRDKPLASIHRPIGLSLWLIAALISLGGCHLAVDPYNDDLARQPAPTTASVEGFRAAEGTPSTRQCPYKQTTIAAVDGTVIHGPLLFEDPFVVAGSEDGQYAWTAEENFYWLFNSAHYLLSASLVPVSLIDTPIWQPYASDGRRSTTLLGLPLDSEPVKIDSQP